jgi:hypothetical protein
MVKSMLVLDAPLIDLSREVLVPVELPLEYSTEPGEHFSVDDVVHPGGAYRIVRM